MMAIPHPCATRAASGRRAQLWRGPSQGSAGSPASLSSPGNAPSQANWAAELGQKVHFYSG